MWEWYGRVYGGQWRLSAGIEVAVAVVDAVPTRAVDGRTRTGSRVRRAHFSIDQVEYAEQIELDNHFHVTDSTTKTIMPPAVGTRMHMSQPSNPFVNLNQQHAHYQSQSQSAHIPNYQSFGNSALNGGISPFNPGAAYGGLGASAFSAAAGTSTFNGSILGGPGQGLGSAAAQAGFARGAAMQEGSQVEGMGLPKTGQAARIREVWRHNLDTEMHMLRQLVQKYPYVAMDAEFPGIVARPIGNFAGSKAEYHYQTLRCNVDILKPIQIGITLYTADGQLPPQQDPSLSQQTGKFQGYNHPLANQNIPCTWVFNFSFNLDEDMYAESSIALLQSAGVNFALHATQGIDHETFGALLTTSGLCFNEDVHWLSFHSGYDFGYLIKLLSNDALPHEQTDFFDLVKIFFPKLWDIKFLLRHAQKLRARGQLSEPGQQVVDHLGSKSGLNDLADELGCVRVGIAHTAGSDAWLTGSVFWSLRSKIFGGELAEDLADQIYGLHGVPAPASQSFRDDFYAAQGTPAQQTNGSSGLTGLGGSAPTFTPSGNPSTPTTSHAGLNSQQTPGQQQYSYTHGLGNAFTGIGR